MINLLSLYKTTNLESNIRPVLNKISKNGDVVFAIAIFGILFVLLFPVIPSILDILLAFSIAISVLVLLTSMFIHRPLEFSVFPTILLVTALIRLSLNIASTRLILSNGNNGKAAAGHVIEAFGNFVMEGNVIIGVIVFIILTIINFVVITKGSGRIAEVAARFSLDAMPGKQMAIDADLAAGLINESTAKTRRKELEDESTFFGAMDGANKFVRGDAIAGLLITFINFIAGIVIGIVQNNMSFQQALDTYTTLTIGDGLVAQIPALIISLSAGLLVSKSGNVGSTEKIIYTQLAKIRPLALCSVLTFFMAIMPGLPYAPFLLISILSGTTAWMLKEIKKEAKTVAEKSSNKDSAGVESNDNDQTATQDEPISAMLQLDIVSIELGYALLPLTSYKNNRLTDQIKALRKQMAKDLGFVIPSVRIQDNLQLDNNRYSIKIKEIECAGGEIKPNMLLIMDPKGEEISIDGENTREPAFGLPAKWIDESKQEEAIFKGYTVVDPPTVITTHFTEIIKENITELLSFSETQKLIDSIADSHKKLISDTVPVQISVSSLQRVLQSLLSEMVSIRDLPTILEAIAEIAKVANNNIIQITEHVRTRLARQLSYAHTNNEGYIPAITLSPMWEQAFMESLVSNANSEKQLAMAPSRLQEFVSTVRKTYEEQIIKGSIPILLVSSPIRPYVRSVVERIKPSVVVLSQSEIYPKTNINVLAQV
ncbi:Flagellar biosynthesis protein flhA [Rickettsiales bacterium Ac37b]|nr:Flagellar biosynthesis protein flhA [Rickettsiales bacterium Ac37b]